MGNDNIDENICFIINVFEESRDNLINQLEKLIELYPNSDIIYIYDGTEKRNLFLDEKTSSANEISPKYLEFQFDRVKNRIEDPIWTHRYLDIYLKNSSKQYCIKIDPDTEIINKLNYLPSQDIIFCNFFETKFRDIIYQTPHGGVLGFGREIARKLIEENYFYNTNYSNPPCFYFQDLILRNVIKEFNIEIINEQKFSINQKDDVFFYHPNQKSQKSSYFPKNFIKFTISKPNL